MKSMLFIMELIIIDFEGHSKVELCLHEIGHHKVRIILSLFVFRTAKVRFILVSNIFEFQRKKSQKFQREALLPNYSYDPKKP